MDKKTYKYTKTEDSGQDYIEVELAGKAELYENESAEQKAEDLIVSTQRVPEESVRLEEVDTLDDGLITSDDTINK